MSSTHAVVEGKANGAAVAAVTPAVVPGQPTYEQLKAQLAALQALVANPGTLTLRVSKKGAVSVYGLGKWPLSLYQGTFIRVLDASEQIRAFIAAHAGELSVKEKKA